VLIFEKPGMSKILSPPSLCTVRGLAQRLKNQVSAFNVTLW